MEYAVFGRGLEKCRFQYLTDVRDARCVLLIGEGDGRFLERLLKASPEVQVDVLDVSAGMLARCRARAGDERVRYFQRDALLDAWPRVEYDLVVTHFVFDCFDAQGQKALAGKAPKVRWLVSEFRARGVLGNALIRVMYAFFGIATGLKTRALADHRAALTEAGYEAEKTVEHRGGLLVSELWRPRPVK